MGARLVLAMSLALAAMPGGALAKKATPLFASDEPIRVTIQGPLGAIASTPAPAQTGRPAKLSLTSPAAEEHAIMLSPRGLTRRKKETCTFPPLRVEFSNKPVKTSLFDDQKRLKLVTHCRTAAGHQQHVLLEFAAYRMFNLVSPAGLRARLGTFDYVEDSGKQVASSRVGFFVEDPDDAAKRNGLEEYRTPRQIRSSQLDPAAAAKAALFEYMIGNTDWSMRSGPAGDTCCHNFRLFSATAATQTGLTPVPYDFDASGLVNAPYAVPAEMLQLQSVRDRRYRGYCIHNAQALSVAAEFRAKQVEIVAVLSAVPGLDERRRSGAADYLAGFFRDIATDEEMTKRLLKTCIN